jgi:TRAP-type mannitol/chloroaromatic compound transport system permease small subunit
MISLSKVIACVDAVNDRVGRVVSWLTVLMVLTAVVVALLRYVFSIGFVWMQESYIWMHGFVFMLGAGYALLHGSHVRVDVFYGGFSARRKAWVDIFGVLFFLWPLVGLIGYLGWGYAHESWARSETSYQAGGLPAVYLLKAAIPLFCVLVGLQGVSLAGKAILVLKGGRDG